jgi:hypothetical protein
MITNLLSYLVLSTTTGLVFRGWLPLFGIFTTGIIAAGMGAAHGFYVWRDYEATACTL